MTGEVHPGLGLEVPAGWQLREEYGTARFLCRARVARPDGVEIDWSTRRHRKGLAPAAGRERPERRRRDLLAGASPSSVRMGALFMMGSALFALGSLPLFFEHVDARLVAWVFFAGSKIESLGIVAVGTALCIGMGWLMTQLIPRIGPDTPLPDEVLARTAPNL